MIWRRSYLVRQVQVIEGDPPADMLAEYQAEDGASGDDMDEWFCNNGVIVDETTELLGGDDELDYWLEPSF
jgi:hypothetical protein